MRPAARANMIEQIVSRFHIMILSSGKARALGLCWVGPRPAKTAHAMLESAKWRQVSWCKGTKRRLPARFAAVRVRIADGARPSDCFAGTVRISVCGRAVEHYAAMARMKRSPKMTANWALAMVHSRGGIFHSFSDRFKIR